MRKRRVLLSCYASRRATGPLAMGLPDVRVRVSTVPVSRYLARTANIIERVAWELRTMRVKAWLAIPQEGG
jgi:hypothetical protein